MLFYGVSDNIVVIMFVLQMFVCDISGLIVLVKGA